KSTVVNIAINGILPSHAVSNNELGDFASDKFATANLYGKTLNQCGDLDDAAIKSIGMIKQITGNDVIPAQRKHGQPFTFKPKAKMLFNANAMPTIKTND